jgi:sphingomyelin synthase-related protein 1
MLTLLNYFIETYTPENWKGLHIFCWVGNIFGMFFILAAHEHYSIDVFIAFYITSRLFVHYHINSQSTLNRNNFFPLFGYFEEGCQGVLPFEFELPWDSFTRWWKSQYDPPYPR